MLSHLLCDLLLGVALVPEGGELEEVLPLERLPGVVVELDDDERQCVELLPRLLALRQPRLHRQQAVERRVRLLARVPRPLVPLHQVLKGKVRKRLNTHTHI